MTRNLTALATTESQGALVRAVALVKLQFDSGDVRVWSGRGQLTWNAETYEGVGDLGKISAVEEGVEQKAFGIGLELSGVPVELVSIALDEDVQGRTCQLWLGFLDGAYTLVADPVLVFQGRMDTMDVELGDTATVSLTAESRLVDWERARIRRYTDADQQESFAGDKGFEFVNETVEKEIVWGGTVAGGQGGGTVAAGQGSAGASTPTTREPGTSGQ